MNHRGSSGAVLLVAALLAACSSPAILPRTKTITFTDLLIDKIYPSMRGPEQLQEGVSIDVGYEDTKNIWVTRYRAEVLSADGSADLQEFMCHSHLFTTGAENAPPAWQGDQPQLSISQGQREVRLPEGFALKIPYNPYRKIAVTGMVLNNNYKQIHKNVQFAISFDYYDDRQAQILGLKPLIQRAAATYLPVDGQSIEHQRHSCEPVEIAQVSELSDGVQRVGHWYVPPGRHVYKNDVTPILRLEKDTRLHYVWMHVHPYAESVELRDTLADRSVWKGMVLNDRELAIVHKVDDYSSAEGLPLFQDHRYELVSVYNNRTDHKIDAMASLWLYVEE